MPLSERLRIQAGRPFIHTLTARLIVAVVLLLITVFVSNKEVQPFQKLHLGNNDSSIVIASNQVGVINVQSKAYDIYGR